MTKTREIKKNGNEKEGSGVGVVWCGKVKGR